MKKFLTKLIALFSATALVMPLAACGGGNGEGNVPTDTTVNVYMPDGAPAIALSAFMDSGYDNTSFTVVSATEIGGVVSNGTADMAIMPINAAATLYNGGKEIVMLSVNTHGNLFIVGSGEAIELGELKGKRLGVIGQGQVPDLTLRILLDELGVAYEVSDNAVSGKVALKYTSDATELLPLLGTGKVDYALLPEPAATNASNKFGKSTVADMQEIWQDTFESSYPQACLVAKKSLVQNNKKYVDDFLTALALTDEWAAANPEKAVAAISAHMKEGTEPSLAALTQPIVERCNIATVAAADCRAECEVFFEKLTHMTVPDLNTPVLAKLPGDGFYYQP